MENAAGSNGVSVAGIFAETEAVGWMITTRRNLFRLFAAGLSALGMKRAEAKAAVPVLRQNRETAVAAAQRALSSAIQRYGDEAKRWHWLMGREFHDAFFAEGACIAVWRRSAKDEFLPSQSVGTCCGIPYAVSDKVPVGEAWLVGQQGARNYNTPDPLFDSVFEEALNGDPDMVTVEAPFLLEDGTFVSYYFPVAANGHYCLTAQEILGETMMTHEFVDGRLRMAVAKVPQ